MSPVFNTKCLSVLSLMLCTLTAEVMTIAVPDQYYGTGSVMSMDQVNWEYDGEGDIGYARPAIHAGFIFGWEHRGFAWFDLENLPGGAAVLGIELHVFCTQYSLDPTQLVNISSMTELPVGGNQNATEVANSMTEYYAEDWDVMQLQGFHSIQLNNLATSSLSSAVNQGTGWWGIGFVGENEGEIPDGSIGGYSDDNPPYIVVEFELGDLGDLNQDGMLDILDILLIVNIILNASDPTSFQLWAADFNSDGDINVFDIMQILNCLINGC